MPRPFAAILFLVLMPAVCSGQATAALTRGKLLYSQHCALCHGASGQGAAGSFPPLAQSDYLMADSKRAIRTIVEGLTGEITVNGRKYNNVMPPAVLNDSQVADVLNFVRNSFGNKETNLVTAAEVKAVRAKSRFPTFETLVKASAYPPLPTPPPGWKLRELARLPAHGSRLASDGTNLIVLGERGDIWSVNPTNGLLIQLVQPRQYCPPESSVLGLTIASDGRFYVAANRKIDTQPFYTNEATIYRSAPHDPASLKPWLVYHYPWGIGPFNHGISHMAFGPDGYLYVSSGSRTDGNESGTDARYWTGGEIPETACLWRLDPKLDKPRIEIYAHGLRNTYGFCWDDRGQMFATDNGPDADAPEELNIIQRDAHYGFPYQFSNWRDKPYAHTPDLPADITFQHPVANKGPDAGGNPEKPLFSVHPHSSPAGIVHLGNGFPKSQQGTLLVPRFGNLLKKPADVGFDLLQVRPSPDGSAEFRTLLAPLARPLDVHLLAGKVYLLEYSRQTNNSPDVGNLPGRVLELTAQD